MSFILDALRKSESERQQQAPASLSTIPDSQRSAPAPRWLWPLAGLLLINAVIVAAMLLKTDASPPTVLPAAQPPQPEVNAVPRQADFVARLDKVRQSRPTQAVPTTDLEAPASAARQGSRNTEVSPENESPVVTAGVATLPSFDEVRLSGRLALPEMRIDLHVYNAVPERRFVSINQNRYREGDTLTDGPTVREITREGVILDYQDTEFVLLK
ncbi:MAG TPA: general secretion pathway protein GspB [Woeseiaceae bacterium]|nr:general secretion pathway protein GspB [Woeseiaceae bacterium]